LAPQQINEDTFLTALLKIS